MKTPSFKCLLSLFTLALSIAGWADRTWTGDSTETTKYWSDTANWDNGTGAYYIGSNATIVFREMTSGISSQVIIGANVEFSASSPGYGLSMSSGAGNALVGKVDGPAGSLTINGGTYHFADDFSVGNTRADGTFTLNSGRIDTMYWMTLGGYGGNCTSTVNVNGGEFIVGYRDGSEVDNGRLVIAQRANTTATFNQTAGRVRSSDNSNTALEMAPSSGAKATYNLSGGTYDCHGDILLGAGGDEAAINIYGDGVLNCETPQHGERWIKVGNSGSGTYKLNLNGGTLNAWRIYSPSSSGTREVNFNGGKLVVLGTTHPIIGRDNNLSVNILSGGGTVDTNGKNATIAATMKGVGTITKQGEGTLALTGGYFGGLAIASGAGAATSPGNQTLSSGSVFLVSGVKSTLPLATAETLASSALWLEEGGFASLSGVALDFSSSDEQKLFTVAGLKLLGTDVAEDTNISSYMSIDGAAAAYKVLYKASDHSIYAVKVTDANVWTGGSNGGSWSDPANWTYAVPDSNYTVSFADGDVVTIDGDVAVSGASFTGNVTFSTPSRISSADLGTVTGSGSLTKAGDGMLSVSALPAGGAVVSVGTLVVPTTATSPISVSQGGLLLVDVSGLALSDAVETQVNIGGLSIPAGAADPSPYVGAKGSRAVCSFVQSGETWTLTTVRLAGSEEMANDYWVAGSASTDWAVASNWSSGAVPGNAHDTAVFPCDAKIVLYDGYHSVRKLVVATGSMVKFWSTNAGKYPTLYVGEVTGGTLSLSKFGLVAQNEVKDSGGADVRCDIVLDPSVYGAGQDCWIEGNSGGATLNFYGTLYATNSAFRVNRGMNLYGTIVCGRERGDDNYFAGSVVKAGGTFKCISGGGMTFSSSSTLESGAAILAEGGAITVEGGATLSGGCSILANGGTINLPWCELGANCTLGGTSGGTLSFSGGTVACGITGSPNITLADTKTTLSLTGDNSGFSGAVSGASAQQKLEFACKDAGSTSAVFSNSAAVTWNFTHSWHEVLCLGALNATDSGAYLWVQNGGPVIEVGAKADSVINCPFTGSDFTLRKVNAATALTLGSGAAMVEGSTVELVAGTLTMPVALLQDSKITVAVTAGNLVLDGSALTGVVPGYSLTLSNATLPAEADPEDCIAIANTDWHWSVALGAEAGTIVVTARHNTWKGGESGNWNDASSWTDGVPSSSEIVQFDAAAEVSIAADVAVAGLVANAAVTFNDTVGTASVALGSVSGTGSVAKKGVGLTTFTGTFADVGFTVESGVAAVPMGSAFGAVTIGEAAALVVDIGSTTLTADTALDLFTATSLSANSDNITDAMLLRGAAANYTFSYENQTVKANITAVHNRTANVRVWHAGVADQYLDNSAGTYYGNTPPNANDSTGLCDAVVVCETATGHGWGGNTGKFRQLLVRGCTFTIDDPTGNNPALFCQYIGGNGTLRFARHGLKRAWGAVTVSSGLTLDVALTSRNTWFGAEGEGDDDSKIMNVNGDIYCTNGWLTARIDSSINGKLVVGGSGSKVEINSGAHLGANMELVIADGIPGTFTNDSGEIIPKVKITGGTVAYSALPETSASVYEMSGGVLTMTLAEATSVDSKKVNVVGGKVDIDVTGNTASVGDTVALAALNIGGDVDLFKTIKFSNYGDNDWTAKVQDNTLVAEISALSNVNVWIGGSKGNWTDAVNWHYGVPTSEQTVSFPSVTEVTITLSSAPTIGTLNLGADVTFTKGTGAADKMHVGAVEGSGKIILDHWGLTQVNGQTLEIANDVVMKNGSWFGDYNYGGVVNMRGNLTVDGEMQIWMKAEIFGNISGQGSIVLKQAGACPAFHGDNRGFHGTIEKNFQNGLTIDGVNAAGDDIAWRIGGDVTLNVKTGVVKFGSLDLWKNVWCVMYLPDGADTVLEVGGNDKDFAFGDGYFLWGNGNDRKNIAPTIRKVGAGTLTSYLYNFKYLDVQEGKVVLNSPSTMDGASYKEIASVAVASGAAIGGNAGSVADRLTISSLTLAPGAIVKQTVTGSGTTESPYSCPTLTVNGNGTVDVTGVKFGLEGDTSATTAGNSSFTLLTATSVTGTPVAEGSIASSIQNKIWKPTVVSDNSVVMSLVKAASGFALFLN